MGFRQSFEYFLPRTVVRFSGRRTETLDELAEEPSVDLEGAIECVEQADPEFPLRIILDGTFFHDREGSIAFSSDRRLTSLSATSTGTAGKLAAGAIRFVTSAVAAVAAVRAPVTGSSAASVDDSQDPVEVQYEEDCPEAAADRTEIRRSVVSLRKAIVRAAAEAPQAGDHAKALRELQAAMRVLTDLQAKAELHFTAWRESKKSVRTQDLAFEVPISSLPSVNVVNDNLGALTPELLKDCWEPFQQLGVFAAVERVPHRTPEAPDAGSTWSGFHFRSPRSVWLSIYEQSAGSAEVRRVERRKQLMYDATCATEYVSCNSGAWNKKSVSVELDGGSGLSKVTTSTQGGAGAVGDALAGAVDQVVKGLADAVAITKSLDTVRDRDIDRRIAQLEKRKKFAEAEVAADAAAADTAKLREIARLNHEKELLTARKDLAALTRSATDAQSANGSDATSAKRIVISLEP